MSKPFVSVIIPNYNGQKYIVNCLESVLNTDYPNFEVIVVDDCSTDGSVTIMEKNFGVNSQVKVIRCSSNQGAAAAKNIGVTASIGEIICFLDNDTEVEPNWLTCLVKVLISGADVGASQSLLIDYNNRKLIQVAGVKLMPYICLAVPILQGRKICDVNLNAIEICGLSAALAVKKHVFYEIGGFDEPLAIYTEDLDFSWRIWLKGYRILLAPDSKVYHWTKPPETRRAAGFSSFSFNFHLTKNSVRCVVKNKVMYLPLTLLWHLLRILLVAGKHRDSAAVLGIIKGLGWSFLHLRSTFITRSKIQRASIKPSIPSFYGFPIKTLSLQV